MRRNELQSAGYNAPKLMNVKQVEARKEPETVTHYQDNRRDRIPSANQADGLTFAIRRGSPRNLRGVSRVYGAASGHGKGHRACVGAAPNFEVSIDLGQRIMPLLSLEPFIHPENLLDQAATDSAAESRFWVLHTRPRAEKKLARQLFDRGVSYFLPTYQRDWRNQGRMFRSYLPLFPGYVFLFGDHEQRSAALETNLVAMVLPVRDQFQFQSDLQRVQRLITSGKSVVPEDRLERGDRVRLVKGPLAGLEGIVLRRGQQLRFVVEVQMLQSAVSAEVENWMLEPVVPRRFACPAVA